MRRAGGVDPSVECDFWRPRDSARAKPSLTLHNEQADFSNLKAYSAVFWQDARTGSFLRSAN